MEILKNLAIPRKTGSDGEKQVRNYILKYYEESKEKFLAPGKTEVIEDTPQKEVESSPTVTNEASAVIEEQKFSFSKDTARIIYGFDASILIFLLFVNVVLFFAFQSTPFRYITLITSALIILVTIKRISYKYFIEYLTRRKCPDMADTANLIYKINGESDRNIIFTANYDTKSSIVNRKIKISLESIIFCLNILIALYSIIITIYMGAFTLLKNVDFVIIVQMNIIWALITWLVTITLSVLFFIPNRNESPGANNNASGVSVLLALVRHFSENPPKKVNLWFVATAAKEEGLVGIHRFIDQYEKYLKKDKTFFINLENTGREGDMVCWNSYSVPPFKSAEDLSLYIKQACEKEKISLSARRAPDGVSMEFMPPGNHNYQSVSLCHGNPDLVNKYIDTPKDTAESISEEALKESVSLCETLVGILQEDKK